MDNDDPEIQNQELPCQVDVGGRMEDDLEDSAPVATPKPILEVLKLVDELGKCLEDVGKLQSETNERFCLADDPKEIRQLAQKRIDLVQLTNLIPQRLKELKEEGWKTIGEKSEGDESIEALFKKIGESREEATKELLGLNHRSRTDNVDEKIEDCEREVRRLQKAEDRLLYALRDLAIGCHSKLQNIKDGRAVVLKTDVKEEPEEETAPSDCNQGDAGGNEFDDSSPHPSEDPPARLHQEPAKKRGRPPVISPKSKEMKKERSHGKEDIKRKEPERRSARKTKTITYFEDSSSEESEEENSGSDGDEEWTQMVKKRKRVLESDKEMVDSEDEAVLIKKDSKMKKRGLLASSIENKRKGSAAGGQREEERENDDDDDMMKGGLGGFGESDDDEPTPVKDSAAKTKKKPRRRDASISGNDEEQDDVDMEDNAVDDESKKDDDEEKDCPVEGCSEKSPSDEALKKHMKTHPRPMICGVCKRQWPSASNLRVHHRVHSGAKPFKCTHCDRVYSSNQRMEEHKAAIHTGLKKHACKECDFKTAYSAALSAHRKRMHHE